MVRLGARNSVSLFMIAGFVLIAIGVISLNNYFAWVPIGISEDVLRFALAFGCILGGVHLIIRG